MRYLLIPAIAGAIAACRGGGGAGAVAPREPAAVVTAPAAAAPTSVPGAVPPVATAPAAAAPAAAPSDAPRPPLALTYLGVAGWQIDAGARTILVDPYFSRPKLAGKIRPDPAAIKARSPARADLVLVTHSHVDHLLDAPSVAKLTGAELVGTASTTNVGRATGLPKDKLITVKGGEDFAFGDYSVRVIPSLHSAIFKKHAITGEIPRGVKLPLTFDEYEEGGTLAYLFRVAGRQIALVGSANFIERELEGLRPDIAILGVGLRQEIHDYTCRVLRALGNPPLVYTNHFDEWQAPPPTEVVLDDDLRAFIDEVKRCSPRTVVVVPKHFERMPQR